MCSQYKDFKIFYIFLFFNFTKSSKYGVYFTLKMHPIWTSHLSVMLEPACTEFLAGYYIF